MKTLIASLLLSLVSVAQAAVEGSTIPNAHVIYSEGDMAVIRGKAPANKKQMEELLALGVEEFLIFKNDTKGEVAKQISTLQGLGISKKSITHIPFLWKDLHDFKSSCEMTMQALRTIEKAVEDNKSIYFHCTVGEDRTGYLAGLWGLWAGTYKTVKQSVNEELCARGYEAGNPRKPYRDVVFKIRETLTPTYLKMTMILSEAKQRGLSLDESLCSEEPELNVDVQKFYCSSKK
ncbi:tyrosine-protein phosphatase [Bdellovibrio bacteriovorus]|uniref:tyrosine-protein phosphatase n=1 Tax=Bdellovibrio bacteriovorus TaxID=959 RepID=UPI0035A5BCEC